MIRFLADENFDHHIIRGLRRRNPNIDILLAQDVGLLGAEDDVVLAWAADQGRVLLSHDLATMSHYAWVRVENQERMTGVLLVSRKTPVRDAIEGILLIAEHSEPEEWNNTVHYLSRDK